MITDTLRLLTEGNREDCLMSCCADWRTQSPARQLKAYKHNIKCAGHLDKGLDPEKRKETTWIITEILRHYEFEAIAFRGLSGALFAPTVAMALDKTLLAVRKGETCHSGRIVEGDYAALRYVIVDDMVSSGDTVKIVVEEIHNVMPWAKCIGVLQYLWLTRGSAMNWEDCVSPVERWTKQYGWQIL